EPECALDYRTPLQLVIATILSAQCTDKRVNLVTPALFARFPDARSFAAATLSEIEEHVKSTGFFRNKAKSIKGFCEAVLRDHGRQVCHARNPRCGTCTLAPHCPKIGVVTKKATTTRKPTRAKR